MPRKRVNVALATQLIARGLTLDQIAPQVGSSSGCSLGVILNRAGVSVAKVKANIVQNVAPDLNNTLTLRLVSQASEVVREKFAKLVDKTADALSDVHVIPSSNSIKELGDAAEPWVRMAKIVHGWGDEERQGLVRHGRYTEVEAQVTPACGVSDTTSSVPSETLLEHKPLEDKPQ